MTSHFHHDRNLGRFHRVNSSGLSENGTAASHRRTSKTENTVLQVLWVFCGFCQVSKFLFQSFSLQLVQFYFNSFVSDFSNIFM